MRVDLAVPRPFVPHPFSHLSPSLQCASISPYPAILEKFCATSEWEPALRLCRYVKSPDLWACLAAMAVSGKELHTAEVAYAAIEQVDK